MLQPLNYSFKNLSYKFFWKVFKQFLPGKKLESVNPTFKFSGATILNNCHVLGLPDVFDTKEAMPKYTHFGYQHFLWKKSNIFDRKRYFLWLKIVS